MNILVCGFMGAGKTTFCSSIKNSDSWQVIELDSQIESTEGLNISQIFSKKGENYFRKVEFEQLCALLEKDNLLISLGGGSLSQQALDQIKLSGAKLVFLNTPFSTCYSRIVGDKDRPLTSASQKELEELYLVREKLYRKADLILSPEKASQVESITELKKKFSP